MNTKDLRVLFIHSGSDLYGASRSLLRLSSRLAEDGAEIWTVLPHEGPLALALREKGITVIIQRTLPVIERQKVKRLSGLILLFLNFFFSVFSLLKLFRQFRPHLVHTMTAVILSSGPATKLTSIPHIWHVRESFDEFGKLWRYYQKYMVWFSTRIICVSSPIAEQFDRKFRTRISVLHNGFPVEEFSVVNEERIQWFRSRYVTVGPSQLIGVVGRIKFQRKGQDVFVRAAGLLRAKFPEARFLCIGSPFPGNEIHLARLLHLIHELGLDDYVLYTGDVEDIKAAIAALDVLVLPSVQPEPFGGVVIEAMALSRPVVATAVGGSIEQIVDGVTGYLVPPGDAPAMAAAIESLLESPAHRRLFGEAGRKRYLEKFEFQAFYEKMAGLYEQTLHRKGYQSNDTFKDASRHV